MGWSGLGVFPFDGFRGVGVGFVGRLFWREGNGWGGVFEGRGGRASGWCMVMVLGGGGVRDGRRGNGDVRVLGRGNEGK